MVSISNLVDEVVTRVFKYSVFAEKLKQRAATDVGPFHKVL